MVYLQNKYSLIVACLFFSEANLYTKMSKHPKGVLRILFRVRPVLGRTPGTRTPTPSKVYLLKHNSKLQLTIFTRKCAASFNYIQYSTDSYVLRILNHASEDKLYSALE